MGRENQCWQLKYAAHELHQVANFDILVQECPLVANFDWLARKLPLGSLLFGQVGPGAPPGGCFWHIGLDPILFRTI